MLTKPEHIEPDLVGKLDLFQQLFQPPLPVPTLVGGSGIDIGEGIEAKFHGMFQIRGFSLKYGGRAPVESPARETVCLRSA